MTKTGFIFIISGVFVYFLANQTQIGWVYLFDALIWSLLVLSAVITRHGLKSLKVTRQVLLPKSKQTQLGGAIEGETVEVQLMVTNFGRFARHFIKILENCPFAPPQKRWQDFFIPRLESKSTTTFYHQIACYKRGHYPSATITLQVSDPLGLMVKKRSFELPLNLTVYPIYYQMEGLPAAETIWAESGQVTKSRVAEELYGSREYQYGDPLKHIHWRNTARLGQFMLKEFEQSHQGSITVIFDTRYEFGDDKETTLEYSIRIAASLARFSADSGRSINIIAGEKALYHADWQEAMNFLARLEAGRSAGLESVIVTDPGQIIVAIVSAKEVRLIPALLKLTEAGKEILVLLEGFTTGEKVDEFSSGLKSNSFEIIHCALGSLEAGIDKLANSRLFGRKVAVV